MVDDVIGAHSFFIGGDFNAHVKVGSLVPVRDRDFTFFVDHLITDGFEMFPARDSTIPTFISAKGATMIDFTFARGLQLKAADSSIIAYEDVGHRVLAVDLELPQLVVNHLKPRQSHRRHLASPPPPPRFLFITLPLVRVARTARNFEIGSLIGVRIAVALPPEFSLRRAPTSRRSRRMA
jgi:hypothetical protein